MIPKKFISVKRREGQIGNYKQNLKKNKKFHIQVNIDQLHLLTVSLFISTTFRRRDSKIVMVSRNPKKCRKSYKLHLVRDNLGQTNSRICRIQW